MSVKIDLEGKNVLISGAGGSIGTEIVFKFLEAGAHCLCLDKNLKNLKKIKSKKNFFNKITFLEIDFEKKNFIKNFLKKMKKNIKIDILINNAGFSSSKNFLKYSLADWKKTLEINLTSPFILSQLVSRKFMISGGSIINITSLAAEQGFPDNVAYVASKGGLKQLTKAMAIDLADKNIRVNSIGPGYVRTKMTEKSWLNKKKKKNRSDRIILNRWAKPKDIANVCLFLGSNLADYINGQEIYVDGGWLSKGLKNDNE
jgi:NAD(P)-dependent dehydrogenase (short-subunit alcohol dehydrogenase family)